MSASVIQLSGLVDSLYGKMKDDAENIIQFFQKRGYVTAGQERYISIIIEKATQKKEPKPTLKVENFHRIIEIFDTARANEYKSPKVRFGDKDTKVVLSEAGENSANAGMIYVKANGEYKGKITRDGEWRFIGKKDDELTAMLAEFSLSPKETVKKFGYATGSCGLCGRKLTNKTSIANGIGPICAEGYGF